MSEPTVNLKETLNLPQTDLPIRAGLINKEPEILAEWEANNIYEKSKLMQEGFNKKYLLHDGPPYPNGNIHMGHALNKTLKDIVVRSKTMMGYKSHFVPGWDCHGLPIETQVIKELKKNGKEEKKLDIPWFRNRCKEFALDYVKTQKNEFQRLGISGEWENPYLTLDNDYESKVIELFGQMAKNGLVYRGRKPIHWCTSCETALAEAEIEYKDHKSPSIYFRFQVTEPSSELAKIINSETASILVWTTTPWTLPANVAIAAHPDFQYLAGKVDDRIYIFLDELKEHLTAILELKNLDIIGSLSGKALKGTKTAHPFIDRISTVINADYITKEDGTGFVHIAPGHGQEDYIVGQEYNLPTIMPVDEKGRFTDEVHWKGLKVFDANKEICMHMDANKTLLKLNFIKHSYPHCWRCKQPVIFRATEQWFIAMDAPMKNDKKTLREKSLSAVKATKWHPGWGEKRIYTMIENRPDWCISRQRFWGIPVPVFKCNNCNHAEMDGPFNKAIVELVKKEGTAAWFSRTADEILPEDLNCSKCKKRDFSLEKDILDVWFESGSSFGAVLENRQELHSPANLYLEGSDQHRGWFHSSMLISIGAKNNAPYKEVLTHGFLVDEKGRKMSKSEGNVIAPQNVIKEYGADILRWWIAGSDFKNDISISKNVLNQSRDSFSKVRNTIRFCISNLYDFDYEKDGIAFDEQNEIDRWALSRLQNLIEKTKSAYENFQYHIVVYSIHDFCTRTLSSLYLDMTKDRLYCDGKLSKKRRSTQTTIYNIADALIKLIAPVLVFTSEDAYKHIPESKKEESIHLEQLPEINVEYKNQELEEKWHTLLNIKDLAYQKLEKLRCDKVIGSFLEADVDLTLTESVEFNDWESLLIVSNVNITEGPEIQVNAGKAEYEKCERCWKRLPLNKGLCQRCIKAIES
ncbi:MAG: isoleucine--tRNA ligase [bacterium]|nr:isoleucine--tRNA ligase [bacterium]